MDKIKIKISYWTYPAGDDFDGIEAFKKDLSNEFEAEITCERTDTLGAGLYEFIVEIITKVDFSDIAKDYLEDGFKVGLGYLWKQVFIRIKELFKKNEKYTPDIEVAKFIFNDIEIIIYPLYQGSIDDVIDEVIMTVSRHLLKIKNETNLPLKSIHIPIFNHVDSYEVCAYRVRLNVDENISSFNKEDYFKLWGIRSDTETDFIYNLNNQSILKTKFYTQGEYDILLDKKFKDPK